MKMFGPAPRPSASTPFSDAPMSPYASDEDNTTFLNGSFAKLKE